MAGIIEREFTTALKAKGLSDEATARIVAAAIVNAYKESGLRADAGPKTDEQAARRENSVGLFQLYIKGVGHGMTIAERQDPVTNCKTMLARKVLAHDGKTLLARAQAGASVSELTAIFCRDLEVPANRFVVMQARAKMALKMFGERVVSDENEIAESIDDGKKGFNGKGIIKLKSNQDTWVFGSSGAVAMNNLKNSLSLGNTGFFGVVGISPGKFYEKLQANWPRISKLKLPKQVVLVGLAANGLGSNTDAAVQKNLNTYASIKKFLEEKGIKVKIATVQPAEGLGDQINRFNEELRKKYGPEVLIDIAKHTTTADGKHINTEYAASDGIHLSGKGYKKFAGLIKEGADSEKTA
jgi:lysophospholipase L1-like esterase